MPQIQSGSTKMYKQVDIKCVIKNCDMQKSAIVALNCNGLNKVFFC